METLFDTAVDLPDVDTSNKTEGYSYIAEPDAKNVAIKFGIIGTGQGGCIGGKTNIYLSNVGIIQIKEYFDVMLNSVNPNDIIIADNSDIGIKLKDVYTISMNPQTGEVSKAQVTAVWRNKALKRKKITFENNSEICCSVTHPTFVFRPNTRHKIYAQTLNTDHPLQIDDRVLDTRGIVLDISDGKNIVFKGVSIDTDMGWLLGLFAGNGSAKKTEHGNEITFYSNDESVINKARRILDFLPFVSSTSVSPQQGCLRLSAFGIPCSIFFKSIFNYEGGQKAHTIRIPSCISASSIETRLAFLAGIIDSDTQVEANWCEMEIATVSDAFADEIACLSSTLGMRPVVSKKGPGKKGTVDINCISFSGKINFGPLFDKLTSFTVHNLRKDRLTKFVEAEQKSFATSSVPLQFEELETWLRKAGFVNGNQTEIKHDISLKNWIKGERKLSLPTFLKMLDVFKNEQLDYVKQIAPCLCTIKNIEDANEEDSFYDLSVDGFENYFAGNKGFVLTHNSRLADTFYQSGYRRCCAINTTAQDFLGLALPTKFQKVLESQGGAGKDPSKGFNSLKASQEEVLNLMRHSFGEDIERIIVCVGAGGGSGSGSAMPLLRLAKYYLANLGKPEKVGMIVTLPKKTEGGKVQANAYRLMTDLKELAANKTVSPLIIVDNESIHQMFPTVSAKLFWPTANKNIVGLFDIFNVLACQKSQYTTFDREDYRSLLDSGSIIFGATKLDSYNKDTDISDGLRTNLKRTLLAEVDIASASHVAAILCAPDNILGVLPQAHIDLAFTTLERILNGENREVMVHQGIYEAKRMGLYLYTMVGGFSIPEDRLNLMKARAGIFEEII